VPRVIPAVSKSVPDVDALLAAAVQGIGGAERPGQVQMAEAVRHAIEAGEHLAVQAGTGTGKSLAYLVPAVRHAVTTGGTIVVATATIALQRQLVDRDLPRLAATLAPLLDRELAFAILKGRRNYLCLNRQQGGVAEDPQDVLFDPADTGPTSPLGRQVKRLHDWAGQTTTGDRDELVPGVPEAAWRQVSVSAQECVGAQRCTFGSRCFAEKAREAAGRADIVVTNHALLAIDATSEIEVLPEHDVVIVDEAHDLVDRVTSATTGELSGPGADAAARRAARLTESAADVGADPSTAAVADQLRQAAAALVIDLGDTPAGRLDVLPETLAATLTAIRDAAGACADAVRASASAQEEDQQRLATTRLTVASLDDIQQTAGRILDAYEQGISERGEVVWLDRPFIDDGRRPPALRVAPLEVGKVLRNRLFGQRTVALTSATLALGGSFAPLAVQWGLPPEGSWEPSGEEHERPMTWTGLDVGSPFDHARSGILYVARHLPPPGRDALPEAYLTELAELIEAAGGRTLGLFSSMRAAREAAGALHERIGYPLLCQGDDLTAQLVRQFSEDEPTCLFGTLSLWQGVDVPGNSLQLVVIDRIPFPRPDDPLASARQRAVAARGGNGFMSVAASHAALLLAQGAGRLLRTMTDRGVVAVLDPRLMTARYGDFLRATLPPFWTTTDPALVRAALRRLAAASEGSPDPETSEAPAPA
jgi:ATP-dependent DNA helicase DinG